VFLDDKVDVMHVSVHGYELASLSCRLCRIPSLAMHMTSPIRDPYWFRRWLTWFSIRSYTHVCSQSQSCTDAWIEATGVSRARCSFVWNGADISRFGGGGAVRPRQEVDRFRLVSVGRLHPMKGYDVVLRALGELQDERVSLTILGDGDERTALGDLADTLGLTERVVFEGHVEDPESYLREADCFVLASVALESCPAVLAEAMASGLPLITSDFGPLAEVNVAGRTGLVVPAGDSSALAGAIRQLADDSAKRDAMGAAGRERAVSLFSRERMFRETLSRYESIR